MTESESDDRVESVSCSPDGKPNWSRVGGVHRPLTDIGPNCLLDAFAKDPQDTPDVNIFFI